MSADIIYSPAWWIPGGHLQTLWGQFFRRQRQAPTRIERWDTPDGDFLEIHRVDSAPQTPRVLLLHGLEGTIRSHYAQGLLNEAVRRGWGADLLIFRSCGSAPNKARRFYHSGETEDLTFALEKITATYPGTPLAIAGVSLGGKSYHDVREQANRISACRLTFSWGEGADVNFVRDGVVAGGLQSFETCEDEQSNAFFWTRSVAKHWRRPSVIPTWHHWIEFVAYALSKISTT